jgi:muramidase (phage lysozyme)
LKNPNVQAFVKAISWAEGGHYNSLFGINKTFDDYSAFPRPLDPKNTPTGAYQITKGTYLGLSKALGLTDFSPHTQDLMVVQLLDNLHALQDVTKGNIDAALHKVCKTWAALPQGRDMGNAYPGQPYKRYEELVPYYQMQGGKLLQNPCIGPQSECDEPTPTMQWNSAPGSSDPVIDPRLPVSAGSQRQR